MYFFLKLLLIFCINLKKMYLIINFMLFVCIPEKKVEPMVVELHYPKEVTFHFIHIGMAIILFKKIINWAAWSIPFILSYLIKCKRQNSVTWLSSAKFLVFFLKMQNLASENTFRNIATVIHKYMYGWLLTIFSNFANQQKEIVANWKKKSSQNIFVVKHWLWKSLFYPIFN